jgi:hypothetical protein
MSVHGLWVAWKVYTPGKHIGVASELALGLDMVTRQRVFYSRMTWHSLRQSLRVLLIR